MIHMTLNEIAQLLQLKQTDFDGYFTGLCIDSRKVTPGALFVAIPGERVDGHDYIASAKAQGAAAALVTRKMDVDLPQLVVSDIVQALGVIGKAWRDRFTIPFFAVTGSNGKTTLKNMIAAILTAACNNQADDVLATIGTLNNHLGLPLTLARLGKQHKYAVIEMGMNHFGEIEYLSNLTRPDIAAITNAGPSHLEGVGDLDGVARAKAEIFCGVAKTGTVILNRDDHYFDYWVKKAEKRHILSFGMHANSDVRATNVTPLSLKQKISLATPKGNIDIDLPLLGQHNVLNALAATACCLAGNISLASIKSGLENIQPAPGRLQVHTLKNGVTVIDDTYNANPFSLQAAIASLSAFKGKRIFVLGDMKELGKDEAALHKAAGVDIRNAGIDQLFTFGKLTTITADAFGERAHHYTDQAALLTDLMQLVQPQTTIVVKGSRSMHMEIIVKGLIAATQ